MKLRHIAIAAVCAAAGSSTFAADFYLSGSSALQKVVAKSIANNCSTLVTYAGLNGSPASGPLDNANGQSQTLYTCTAAASNSWGLASGTVFNISLNTQGSAYGVFPVAANSAISFIDPASCNGTTFTCNAVLQHAPDAGLSDLEPTMFNDASNHPVAAFAGAPAGTVFPKQFASAPTITTSSFASSKIAATQTFGLAVNNKLLADLQADQGLSPTQIPTVSSSAFATIYAPGYGLGLSSWAPFFTNGGGTPGNQVNICSRLPGSGTRASAQAFFLQAPFSKYLQSFATSAVDNTNDATLLGDSVGQNVSGIYAVGEYDNSAAVVGCITNTVAGGYAIGLLSTDRASGGTANFTFVNLDGSVPNASAARFGKYQWVYEAYFQVNKAGSANQSFANAFYNAFKTPANITALGAPSTNGVMAAASNCTGANVNNAVCSHVSRSNGNARAALTYAQ